MAITEAQREIRKKHLGSSDVAAIMGFDRFKDAYAVWAEKTGRLEDEPENDAMRRGTFLEPAILNFAEFKLGAIERDGDKLEFFKEELHLVDHPDGIVIATGDPLEAKSQGSYSKEVWGDEGTDEVPDRVIFQTHVHMICTDKDYCHIPVLLPYRDFQMFGIERDKEVSDIIAGKCVNFWDNHVVKDIPPAECTPTLDVMKRIRREPARSVPLSEDLVHAWLALKAAATEAVKAKDTAQAAMLVAMGDAEAGTCALGQVTYIAQSKEYIDSKRLTAEMPEVAAKYVKESTYRVARFKKLKG